MRLAAFCGLLVTVQYAAAEDWPRFRGVNGQGVSSTPAPAEWTDRHRRWSVELAGAGHGSPAIYQGKVFVQAAQDARRSVMCIDASSGQQLWRQDVPYKSYKKHRNNSFASSTPAVDDEHVYVLWQSREASPLTAYTHDGEKKWVYDLGPYLHGQGAGTSPIVAGNLVVVCNDHSKGSFLLAVDRQTGREIWKIPRQGKRACYATPCIRPLPDGGHEIIFSHCFEGVIGVDPATGKTRWHVDVFGRFPQRAVGSPILWDQLVVASSGAALGEKNVVVVRAANGQAAQVAKIGRSAPHVPTPLVYRGTLFLWSDAGIVTAYGAAEAGASSGGELPKIWQQRVGGKYYSSPICVGGKLYNIDETGTVVVLDAGERFQLLAKNELNQTTRASLAAADGVIFVRTQTHLLAIGEE